MHKSIDTSKNTDGGFYKAHNLPTYEKVKASHGR